jgi:sulfhydrogenase subunit delta
MDSQKKLTLAVWKFASCDGCQLSLVDCTEGLSELAEALEILVFPEISSRSESGPYDISIVEGSISTEADRELIQEVRRQSHWLITIGACATTGGIQALRNYRDSAECLRTIYAEPSYIDSLSKSSSISEEVSVDYALRGCPVHPAQLSEVIAAFLKGRSPRISSSSVCIECKTRNTTCLLVSDKIPCLGPITHAGCGAICPAFNRGCFGCYGSAETANIPAISAKIIECGVSPEQLSRLLHSFNPPDWFTDEEVADE